MSLDSDEEEEDKITEFLEGFRRFQKALTSISTQSQNAMLSSERQMKEFQRGVKKLQKRLIETARRFRVGQKR